MSDVIWATIGAFLFALGIYIGQPAKAVQMPAYGVYILETGNKRCYFLADHADGSLEIVQGPLGKHCETPTPAGYLWESDEVARVTP